MAFNTDPGVKPAPGFNISEQGMRTPTIDLSGALKGIGDVFEGWVSVKDTNNQKAIEDTIRSEADVSNDIVTNGQHSAMTAANAPSDSNPPELDKSFKRLDVLNQAYKQGKVNEAAYWARLNAVAKELRVKYPNYDSIIDSKFSSITGQIPANALRNQLISDAERSANSRNTLEKERRADIDSWAKEGALPANWRELYSQGESGWNKIQDHAYRTLQLDASNKRTKANMEIEKASGELTEDKVYQRAGVMINNQIDNIFKTAFDSAIPGENGGLRSMIAMVSKAKDPSSPGGAVVTEQERQQVLAAFTAVKGAVGASVDQLLHQADGINGKSIASYFTDRKKIDDLKKNADDRLSIIQDLVSNDQHGLLAWNKNMIDNIINGDAASALERDEFTRRISTLRKLWGDNAVNFVIQTNMSKFKNSVDLKVGGDAVTNSAVNGTPLGENLKKNKASPEATAQSLKMINDLIAHPDVAPEVLANTIKSVFGEGNTNFLQSFNPRQQAQVFGRLVNPTTTSVIRKMSESDPKIWANYKSWVQSSAIPALGTIAANTIRDVGDGRQYKVEFDGNNFVIKRNSKVLPDNSARANLPVETYTQTGVQNSVRDMNTIINSYRNVLEAEGTDPQLGIEDLFQKLHLAPEPEKDPEPTFFEKLQDSVNEWWKGNNTSDAISKGSKGGTKDQNLVAPFPKSPVSQGTQPNSKGLNESSLEDPRGLRGTEPTRVRDFNFSANVNNAITSAANNYDVDENLMRVFANIESSGDPLNRTGRYQGLFQLSNEEFAKWGPVNGSIYDPNDNAMAAAAKLRAESIKFENTYGRKPEAVDIYMVHQQGEGGYRNHLKNPGEPAYLNMANTGEGQGKRDPEAWGKKAIWGNVPDGKWKQYFGSVENITSLEFVEMWRRIINEKGVPTEGSKQTDENTGLGGVNIHE